MRGGESRRSSGAEVSTVDHDLRFTSSDGPPFRSFALEPVEAIPRESRASHCAREAVSGKMVYRNFAFWHED